MTFSIRLWPTSFVGRSVATTLISLVAAQLAAAAAFATFVLVPQSQRMADVVSQSLVAVVIAADGLSETDRARLVEQLGRSELIDVWPGNLPPPAIGRPPRPLERIFMQSLVNKLPQQREMDWRTDAGGRLWLHLALGPEWYWVSVRSPLTLRPAYTVLLAVAVTLALTLFAAMAAQRRIARPLGRIAEHARTFRPRADPPDLLVETGPDEVAALSHGYNALIRRLHQSEEDRAIMLAGVSHDIRTPLTKLRLSLEMLGDADLELVESARRQILEIDRVVDQFVAFARGTGAESPYAVDVDALVQEVVASRRADGVAVTTSRAEAGVVTGRCEALRRSLLNLIDNAARYGAPPIMVEAYRAGPEVVLAVQDAGEGLPEDRLEDIVQPFVRGEGARGSTGAGLGLAIAAQAARSHSGDLRLTNADGGGLRVEMAWPLTAEVTCSGSARSAITA